MVAGMLYRETQDGAHAAQPWRAPPVLLQVLGHLTVHGVPHSSCAHAPAGPGFANIVLNNSALCCCLGTGVKKEKVARSFLGTAMEINKSLPAMPPVLVGKLDEATWKALRRDMSNTGGFYPSTGLIICSTLTCTVGGPPAVYGFLIVAAFADVLSRRASLRSPAASCRASCRCLTETTRRA